MVNVAINGFGRIGRMVFRAGLGHPKINFVVINDLTSTENLAYLLKYDSVHKGFKKKIEFTEDSITVDGNKVSVVSEKDPEKLL